MLFPYAKSSISLIFVQKTQFSSLKKRLFIAYITKILGGIFLVCKNLSFGIVKSKIDHFRKVPCEHTVHHNIPSSHVYFIFKNIPTNMFIPSNMIIKLGSMFPPTCLFHPTCLLGTLEYVNRRSN